MVSTSQNETNWNKDHYEALKTAHEEVCSWSAAAVPHFHTQPCRQALPASPRGGAWFSGVPGNYIYVSCSKSSNSCAIPCLSSLPTVVVLRLQALSVEAGYLDPIQGMLPKVTYSLPAAGTSPVVLYMCGLKAIRSFCVSVHKHYGRPWMVAVNTVSRLQQHIGQPPPDDWSDVVLLYVGGSICPQLCCMWQSYEVQRSSDSKRARRPV